jgi:hypothetical protein
MWVVMEIPTVGVLRMVWMAIMGVMMREGLVLRAGHRAEGFVLCFWSRAFVLFRIVSLLIRMVDTVCRIDIYML